jgi:hypothetical protein
LRVSFSAMIGLPPADVPVVVMPLREAVDTTAEVCEGFGCTLRSGSCTATMPGPKWVIWYACTSLSGVLNEDASCGGGRVPYEMVEAVPLRRKP